jgi:N-acyl homoserine lactone hydrolase
MTRLYVLDGGMIDILDWQRFRPSAPPGSWNRIANPCYLVVHPAGILLWDTGAADDLQGYAGGFRASDVSIFHVTHPVADQLTEIGVTAASIDFLALSHFHRDHAGNVGLPGRAQLLAQGDEYDAAMGGNAEASGYFPDVLDPLRGNAVLRLNGDHDVFGDGSVTIKRSPGHTIGHQTLLVSLAATGKVLLSGDLAHSEENWADGTVPGLNFSAAQSLASMRAARDFLQAEGASLWVQHDLRRYRATRHAPSWYE